MCPHPSLQDIADIDIAQYCTQLKKIRIIINKALINKYSVVFSTGFSLEDFS